MGEAIMARKSIKNVLLSLSVAVVLSCSWSGSVFADGDRVEALEARIAELEALVHQLLNAQQQPPPTVDTAAIEARAEEIAEEKISEVIAEHKAIVAEQEHKHAFKFGGFVKLDTMYSDYSAGSYSGAGRDFYIPGTIPVGDGEGETYLDFHIKESRINFKSAHNLDSGAKMTTMLEFDFQLSGQGNERVSNSWSPRVRHAFFTYNKWLFGQTWMTFFNVGALPENLDFVGPAESTIFGRQAMIRYTTGNWQFALENPETTITPYGGGGRIVADDNRIPDMVARWKMGSFTVAGILRELRYENNAAGIDDSTSGYGISLSGKHKIGERDDFRWMATAGKGLGRYVGLNTANGAVLDADGNLDAIETTSVFGSYRHFWGPKWRSNLTLGYLSVDNDTALTGTGVTSDASSLHINLIYSPVPRMDFGIEFMHANREIESGADGDLDRLQFSAKYAY
jgi:hypothetical protein